MTCRRCILPCQQMVNQMISLRVVGIFFNTQVDLGAAGGTVADVLNKAVTTPTQNVIRFAYLDPVGRDVSAFFVEFSGNFNSRISGRPYPAGEYFLTENLDGNPYRVWQYYIFDADGRQVLNDPSFTPYFRAQVQDGWSVVWRLVTILNGPVSPPTCVKALINDVSRFKSPVSMAQREIAPARDE